MDDKGRGFDSRHLHLIMPLTCGNVAIGVELHSRHLQKFGGVDVGNCCIYAYTRDNGSDTGSRRS